MLTGGYQIIDLDNVNHTPGVGILHEGIYDKIEGTRKAILLSGLVVDDIEYRDIFVEVRVNESNFVMTVYGKTITITDTDVVTVANA